MGHVREREREWVLGVGVYIVSHHGCCPHQALLSSSSLASAVCPL